MISNMDILLFLNPFMTTLLSTIKCFRHLFPKSFVLNTLKCNCRGILVVTLYNVLCLYIGFYDLSLDELPPCRTNTRCTIFAQRGCMMHLYLKERCAVILIKWLTILTFFLYASVFYHLFIYIWTSMFSTSFLS